MRAAVLFFLFLLLPRGAFAQNCTLPTGDVVQGQEGQGTLCAECSYRGYVDSLGNCVCADAEWDPSIQCRAPGEEDRFQAQQAGEKALKAVLYAAGRTSIVTHSLRRLVSESAATDAAFADLDDEARLLDQHYIPTRYPNGLDSETTPSAYYDEKDAERCLRSARLILERASASFAS